LEPVLSSAAIMVGQSIKTVEELAFISYYNNRKQINGITMGCALHK